MEAFKSTLEEARYADVILHVVDASSPDMEVQMHTVYETLQSLEVLGKPVYTLFNKADRLEEPPILRDFKADETMMISAKTGLGLELLKEKLTAFLRSQKIYVEQLYPYAQAGKIQLIRTCGQLLSEEYREDGIAVTGYIPAELFVKILPE